MCIYWYLQQQSPTFLALGTDFMEDNFSMDQDQDGFGMSQVLYIYCDFISNLILPLVCQQVLVHGLEVGDPWSTELKEFNYDWDL